MHKYKKGDNEEDINIVATIILRWIFEKYDGVLWTRFFWLRTKRGNCSHKHNRLSGYITC
jgi:hypothetical protein